MAFDYKKECKELYVPSKKPSIVDVPPMNYIAVRGSGDPNVADGEYKRSIELLYPLAFTIKMSKKGSHRIAGYFDYVVPPLEGFWWQDGTSDASGVKGMSGTSNADGGIDYSRKSDLHFISCIRLPDFVTKDDFEWAVSEATTKKKQDFSAAEFMRVSEGLCVQSMHIGPYDDEPATIESMHDFAESQGYALDLSSQRLHHEIYLSDPRRCAPEKLRTVVRHPVRKAEL